MLRIGNVMVGFHVSIIVMISRTTDLNVIQGNRFFVGDVFEGRYLIEVQDIVNLARCFLVLRVLVYRYLDLTHFKSNGFLLEHHGFMD